MVSKLQTQITFLLIIGLFFLPPLMLAQDTADESTEITEQTSTDPDLATASDALMTFLRSFPDQEKDRPDNIIPVGIKVLDAGSAPVSDIRKKDLAIAIKQIIDKYEFIEEEEIDRRVGDSDIFRLIDDGLIKVVLAENSEGNWQFTPDTVTHAEEMYELVRNRENVAGVNAVEIEPLGFKIRDLYPESLKEGTFILHPWQWISLLIVIGLAVAADRFIVMILVIFTTIGLKRTKFEIERDEQKQAVRPFGLLALAGVVYLGINQLLLPVTVTSVLTVAVTFVASISFVWAAYRGVDAISNVLLEHAEKTESKIDDLIVPFVARIAKIFVVAFGLVFIASQLDVNITSLLAGLGLGGLAFALAAKDTVENIFGSLTVLIDQPFSVGDWIVIEGTVDGSVETVGLRSTRVRTFYNSLVTVPNATLIRSAVDNYGKRTYRRWKTTLSVTYDTPPEKIEAFCEGIRELIRLHPYTRKDYYHVYANDYGASSLDILLYTFFEAPDWGTELRERHRLFLDVLRLAERLEIEFAFPTQTIHIPKEMPEHANNPSNQDEAYSTGVSLAHKIMHENFGSRVEKPDPVTFPIPAGLSTDEVEKLESEHKGGDG